MAFDLDVILPRIQHLEEAIRELHLLRTVSLEEFESDFRIYRSAERLLQVSAQAIFDIGEHLLASELCSVPQTYRDIMRTLGCLGVLPKDFARELEPLAGFRNILVHEYLEVDRRMIYQILQQRLSDFSRFVRYVMDFIERGNRDTGTDSEGSGAAGSDGA